MTCRDVLELVEPIASGDLVPDIEVRDHLESCPACAGVLAAARRLEALLAARPAPEAPPHFTAAVYQRIRAELWQAEQRVDRIFNVAIAAAVVLVIAAGIFMVNAGLVLDAVGALSARVATAGAEAAHSAAPSLGAYIAATGLLVSGLVMWWWAES